MSRVVHFEIHADDIDRARSFYERAFGWSYEKHPHEDYWISKTGPDDKPGINGALMKRSASPVPGGFSTYMCTIGVDNLDDTVRRIEEHKGKCVRPKRVIPGVGWHCHCMDTEGNIFGLMQHDPSAA